MTFKQHPVDAKAAKKRLRVYAVAIPLSTLVGGWCTLLMLAWLAFPAGLVDHIPTAVKVSASAVAACWLYWMYRIFNELPALIDEILKRGLALDSDHGGGGDQWIGGPGQRG